MTPEAALAKVTADVAAARGVALPEREVVELSGLLWAGHQRAVQREDVARFDQEVDALSERLVAGLQLEQLVDGRLQVSTASIREVLRRLCPVWPFC